MRQNERFLCTKCLYHLPKNDYQRDNEIEQRFWGRVKIELVASLLRFHKGSSAQKLLHHLKYKGYKEIGDTLGEQLGTALVSSAEFSTIDVIVPVPLHPKRLKKRGYNQSELIANGLARKLNKPIDTKTLIRIKENATQTNKGRFDRWENVSDIFALTDTNTLANKHVLLVDDVLTTGATIEACVKNILLSENAKVSVATLAAA